MPSSRQDRNDENDPSGLLSLPVEILQNIFLMLDSDFLLHNVRLVCKRFCSILTDDVLWKKHFLTFSKFKTKQKQPCPPLQRHGLFNKTWKSALDVQWRDVDVQFFGDIKKWTYDPSQTNLNGIHTSTVDIVHILKGNGQHCISGGRDRLLAVWDWNLNTYVDGVPNAHNGWIWDLDSIDKDTFYSCGWDSAIVSWKLLPTGPMSINSYRGHSPVMAIVSEYGLLACGLIDSPRILLIDPRVQAIDTMSKVEIHRSAVTDLAMHENTLVSTSEDKTMSIYDLRMKKPINDSVKVSLNDSYPRSVGIKNNLVYVGDTRGNIHIFDAYKNYNKFQIISLGAEVKHISSVIPRYGSLLTGSTDSTVRLIAPTTPHAVLNEFKFDGEVTSMEYKKNVIVASLTSNCIAIMKGPQ